MLNHSFFNILDSVDSTNNYAMARVHAGLAKHGEFWFSKEQTAGKGQRGKSWVSDANMNIAMSLVLAPGKLKIAEPFHLSAAIACICFDFFKQYAGVETKIKWPNDIFWRDRKAGGILIENVFAGRSWKWSVVGIGININQTNFCDEILHAVSLKQITGKQFDIIGLAKELHQMLISGLTELKPAKQVLDLYNEHLYKKNKKVSLKKDTQKFETVIKEVTAHGRLVTVDALEREFNFGEVEWVL